jgi:hypothetical protein
MECSRYRSESYGSHLISQSRSFVTRASGGTWTATITVLLCVALSCFTSSHGQEPEHEQSGTSGLKKPKEEGVAIDAREIIDALENHNRAPKIVGAMPDEEPLFDKKYDWREQDRVAKAIQRLVDHAEQAWPELFKHFSDNRYSITYCRSFSADRPINYDIGDVCNSIVLKYLAAGYNQHRPPGERAWRMLHVPFFAGNRESVKKWCQARAGKKLYELQIEMCERAIPLVAGLTDVPEETRGKSIAAIKSQIDELRKSRTAVKVKAFAGTLAGTEMMQLYSKQRATRIRERHEEAKQK